MRRAHVRPGRWNYGLDAVKQNTSPEHAAVAALFVSEWCETDPEYKINAKVVTQAFYAWCKTKGLSPLDGNVFGRAMTLAGFPKQKYDRTGVRLREEVAESLRLPRETTAAVERAYKPSEARDVTLRFLAARCSINNGSNDDVDRRYNIDELTAAFTAWRDEVGELPVTPRDFRAALSRLGFHFLHRQSDMMLDIELKEASRCE